MPLLPCSPLPCPTPPALRRQPLHTTATPCPFLYQGYEILNQASRFVIVFENCRNAVQFALDLQIALTDAHWPAALLDLPECRMERNEKVSVVAVSGPLIVVDCFWYRLL